MTESDYQFDGLYQITRDSRYGAADVREDKVLLFPIAPGGRTYHDRAVVGDLSDLDESASLREWNNTTLAKAADMIRAGVPVRF